MKSKHYLALATCLFSFSSYAFSQANPSATPATVLTDSQIVGVVETANMGEIDAGKLAQKQGKAKPVKDFAKMMVSEHTQVNKDLKALAKRVQIKESESEPQTALKTSASDSMKKLKGLKGAEFDKAYAADQVTMHQTVLDSLDSTLIPNAKQQDLKTMLTKIRESVATHLDKAKSLQSSAGSQM